MSVLIVVIAGSCALLLLLFGYLEWYVFEQVLRQEYTSCMYDVLTEYITSKTFETLLGLQPYIIRIATKHWITCLRNEAYRTHLMSTVTQSKHPTIHLIK
jgi:hypothetical protein